MLDLLLPPETVWAELHGAASRVDPTSLPPQERAAVALASVARQEEFAGGRACARRCARELGSDTAPVLPGPHGAPQWPVGVCGSITHCSGYVGAALARTSAVAALGIDVEPAAPLDPDVLGFVATDAERGRLPGDGVVPWSRVLWCAKEAAFKVGSVAGQWLEPDDVEVTLSGDGQVAVVLRREVVVGGLVRRHLAGRWAHAGPLVGVAVLVPASR